MPYDAIVHAPRMRAGARVNIAKADQDRDESPARIDKGSEIKLRFGVCCPDQAEGTIVDRTSQPESAVLALNGERWLLMRGVGGVTTPGLISEDWFVTQAVAQP